MLRAAWFIKLSYAYTVAVSEVKIKKRQLSDPSQGKEGFRYSLGVTGHISFPLLVSV
jgi:hypothetical protein